jgi:hypothetical protein
MKGTVERHVEQSGDDTENAIELDAAATGAIPAEAGTQAQAQTQAQQRRSPPRRRFLPWRRLTNKKK